MDRKFKVRDSAAGDSSADGAESKEAALEKLRKMEWKRNTQDPYHLARPNSRSKDVQERKKYNKEEDNYFEGTGVQKTRKVRKPRMSENTRPVPPPPGFCVSKGASAPPQVNAWAQKKGSALFQKEDEIDEQDPVLKLVLEESLRSAEEDQKRRMGRLMMTNLDLPSSTQKMCAEKDWEEEFRKKESYSNSDHSECEEDSPKAELHFVETDPKDESTAVVQRHRTMPPRGRKISPREKSALSLKTHDRPESENEVSPPLNKNIRSKEGIQVMSQVKKNEPKNEDFYEPSRPQVPYSKSIDNLDKTSISPVQYTTTSDTTMLHRSSMMHVNNNSEDLSTTYNSTMTFGDTQGLLEEKGENNRIKQTGVNQNSTNETCSYSTEVSDCSAQIKPKNPSEPSETDILLHSFIRREPPSDLNSFVQSPVSDMSLIKQSESNDSFSQPPSPTFSSQNVNSVQGYTAQQMVNPEQYSVMNGFGRSALPGGIPISNGREPSPSASGSPHQIMTPYGSFERELPSNLRTSVQVPPQVGSLPYPYPYTVESNQERINRQLQALQLMNQNVPPGMNAECTSLPAPVRNVVPINPQVNHTQCRLPNSNIMMPPYQGQHVSPLLFQHQIQQANLQQLQMSPGYMNVMALEAARMQQSQLAANNAQSDDNNVREQGNINPPQMQSSHQLLTQSQVQVPNDNPLLHQDHPQLHNSHQQNQAHVLQHQHHLQMISMQNQPLPVPSMGTSTPKQEELLQQQFLQSLRTQSGRKSKEELQMEYQNILQAFKRVQEEMQEAEVQPNIPVVQAQPAWGTMPLAANQFFPIGMVPQVHQNYIQHLHNVSPATQHAQPNMPGSINITPDMNRDSEMNPVQQLSLTATELKTGEIAHGRGRGRIN